MPLSHVWSHKSVEQKTSIDKSSMIILRSNDLLVRIDPRHGGEILDLVHLISGRQLLGRPPFGSNEPEKGDLDEATWTKSYRGGWQLLAPNAGHSCIVDGTIHGFHGRASNDPWGIQYLEPSETTLVWVGHQMEIVRRVVLRDDALTIFVRVTALADCTPLVTVEHIAFGIELLDPIVEIDLPRCVASEIDESGKTFRPRSKRQHWPDVHLLDGTIERSDRWALQQNRSRLLCLTDLAAGWAVVRNPTRGIGVAVAWETDWLRHLWMWHEVRTACGPWRRQAELLILEPASTPYHYGLAQSLADGFASRLERGEICQYRIIVRPFTDCRSVRHVNLSGQIEYR